MLSVPVPVLGENGFSSQIGAIIEREQQIAMTAGVVGPCYQGCAIAFLRLGVASLREQRDRQITETAMALLKPW